MPSPELQILIEAIRVVLLKASPDKLLHLLNNPKIDWKRLEKMVAYHQIRPVVYEALRQVNFYNDFAENLAQFSKKQAVKNIVNRQELVRILLLFKGQHIDLLPYKGVLFLDSFYQNKPLRESGDVDLIVKPSQAAQVLQLLINDGYILMIDQTPSQGIIEEIVKKTPIREISLQKTVQSGLTLEVDLHWGINETFQSYAIDLDDLFETAAVGSFQHKQVLLPSLDSVFKMLLNHHGGRDCWLKLKDCADLIAFMNAQTTAELTHLRQLANQMKMTKVFETGLELLGAFFYSSIAPLQPNLTPIVRFWEKAQLYDKVIPKFLFRKIHFSLQDKEISWLAYVFTQIKYYSVAHPFERKRAFYLSEQYVLLNASSKLLAYLWYRLVGAK